MNDEPKTPGDQPDLARAGTLKKLDRKRGRLQALDDRAKMAKERKKGVGVTGTPKTRHGEVSQAKPLKNNEKKASVTGVTGVTGGVSFIGPCTIKPFDYSLKLHDQPIKDADLAAYGRDIFYRFVTEFKLHVQAPEGSAEVASLWELQTHVFGVWRVAPRLVLSSPEPECGKTTAMSLLLHTVARGHPVSNTSASPLYRGIAGDNPPRTTFMDELDSYTDDMKKALINILNSGHTPEFAYVDRSSKNEGEGYTEEHLSTFAPICMATIKKLPATWKSRSIIINLQRKHPGHKIQEWDTRPPETDQRLELIRNDSAWWAEGAYPKLLDARSRPPKLPSGVGNREAQNLRPLFAIAELLGLLDVTEKAYINLKKLNINEPSKLEELLIALGELLKEKAHLKNIHTQTLIEKLNTDRRWRSLDGLALAAKLSPIGVKPIENAVREYAGGRQLRGYLVEDLRTAIAVYAPMFGTGGVTGVTPVTDGDFANEINDLPRDGFRDRSLGQPVTATGIDGKTRLAALKDYIEEAARIIGMEEIELIETCVGADAKCLADLCEQFEGIAATPEGEVEEAVLRSAARRIRRRIDAPNVVQFGSERRRRPIG